MEIKKILSKGTLPFWAAGIAAALACGFTEWYGDAIDYEFIYPDSVDGMHSPDNHIDSLSDIWKSQCLHYLYMNGRFFVHFIVQLFCGLLGKWWFALADGIVWGLLPAAMLKTAGCKITFRTSSEAVTLALLLMFELRADPPFQINYVWMSLMMMGFMLIFFRRGTRMQGWYWYVLSAIYCFLFGEGNEGFSIPLGGALIAYAAVRKFRLSSWQWTAAIALGIGALVGVAAPGNWARIGIVSALAGGLNRIEGIIPGLILPALYIVTLISTRRRRGGGFAGGERVFLWTAVLLCYVLCAVFKASSGARMLIGGNLLIAVLLLNRIRDIRLSGALCAVCAAACAAIYGLWMSADREMNKIAREMYAGYVASSDGTVYVDDAAFAKFADQYFKTRDSYRLQTAWRYPGRPALRLRPESLRKYGEATDTNAVIPLGNGVWVMLCSESNPAEFVVRKHVLPGIIDRPMADRVLVLEGNGSDEDVVFDTIGRSKVGLYVNVRPYLGAEVEKAETAR